MTLVSPTSQVDNFLNSCLSGGREEKGQSRHINDDKTKWGDRERSRDEHERRWDRCIDGHTQKRNDEQHREGDSRYGQDRRHDERRSMVKREPVDLPPNDGRTRDPRRAHGVTTDPRVRIKREMDDNSGMFYCCIFLLPNLFIFAAANLNGRSDQWKRVKRKA
ncbi:hypothetical protein F5146DRAFT_391772 [Armillaria mellea]|nr:hypothetical protein F5146DRAFT_391772 [Armillaria mellea]